MLNDNCAESEALIIFLPLTARSAGEALVRGDFHLYQRLNQEPLDIYRPVPGSEQSTKGIWGTQGSPQLKLFAAGKRAETLNVALQSVQACDDDALL